MSDPKRSSGSVSYTDSPYHDQFIKSDPKRSSGSSAFSSLVEPPPVPPPDFTKVSTEEWARQRKPPLKGIIAEPEWRPSIEEAEKVLGLDKSEAPKQSSLYRRSGTSDIMGRAAEAPDQQVHNLMPGGTRHSAGGEKVIAEPTLGEAISMFNPVNASKTLFQMHCFRTATMTSIASGFAIAGALWSVGKRTRTITNGAFWTFLVTNVGAFAWCERKREMERKTYRLVREAWEESRITKAGEWERLKAERERTVSEKMDNSSQSSWFWKSRGREG